MVDTLEIVNIDNLTSLWKLMGVKSCPSQNSSNQIFLTKAWPHRCWLESRERATQSETTVGEEFILGLPTHAIVPIWDYPYKNSSGLEQSLINRGLIVSFTQTAMYLDTQKTLETLSDYSPNITISRLTADMNSDIQVWVATASEAFGYVIDSLVIQSIAEDPNIFLLLAKINDEAVATAMLYRSGDGLKVNEIVFGVHQMGVPSRHSGQGIAGAVMNYVIGYCRQLGGRYLTLQASVAGEGLYRRIGFVSQFGIRNYCSKHIT